MEETQPDQDKVSGKIEPEKKRNKSDMEICKDDGEDSEVDTYNECYVCKKYREQ